MTSRRVTFVLLAIALVGVGWWSVARTANGKSCDDGRGVWVSRSCFNLGAAVIDTSVDGVDDLRPLADFKELRLLEIDLEDLDGDLAGLEDLTNLDTLIIRGDGETIDLAPIGALGQLQFLQLVGFEGRNLAGITLPVLEGLTIDAMTIDGPPTMEALVEAELTELDLAAWDWTASAAGLRVLEIRHGDGLVWDSVADLTELRRLSVLTTFDGDLGLDDFGFAAGLTNLEELYLDRRGTARDLAPLAELPLRVLHLEGFPIDDLSPLGATVTLEELSVRGASIDTLEPLGPLTNLHTLEVSAAGLRTVDGIESLTALERVQLGQNPIQDLGPLSGLTGLTELYLDETQVADLTPLASLTELTRLSLWGAPVTDIASLEGLPLLSIDLNSTNVGSVAPLADTQSLESLRIGSTAVTDLSPLRDLPNLSTLVPPDGRGADTRAEVVELLAG